MLNELLYRHILGKKIGEIKGQGYSRWFWLNMILEISNLPIAEEDIFYRLKQ